MNMAMAILVCRYPSLLNFFKSKEVWYSYLVNNIIWNNINIIQIGRRIIFKYNSQFLVSAHFSFRQTVKGERWGSRHHLKSNNPLKVVTWPSSFPPSLPERKLCRHSINKSHIYFDNRVEIVFFCPFSSKLILSIILQKSHIYKYLIHEYLYIYIFIEHDMHFI